MGRKLATFVAILGVLLVVAASAAYVLVDRYGARLPGDTDETRNYEGTAQTLLDSEALAVGNLDKAILTGVPITVQRHTRVADTDGDTALVQEERTTMSGGKTIGRAEPSYAVDRHSLEATSDHPSSWDVVDAKGIVVSWPFGAEKHDYTGWVSDAQATTTLRYVRSEEHAGVDTYVYQSNVSPVELKDPEVLATLPKEASVELLAGLARSPAVPADVRAQLATLVPQLTGPVPLSYTYEVRTTYWVEPTTGAIIDLDRTERRVSMLAIPGQDPTPFLPVTNWSYRTTSGSVDEAVADATDGKDALDLWGRTVPLTVGIVGLVLLLLGVVFMIRPRRRRTA